MKHFLTGLIATLFTLPAYAQHKHNMDNMGDMKMDEDTAAQPMPMHYSMNMMPSSYSLHLPMNRDGSGTAWLPDNSPMYAYMLHSKGWMFMLHANQFIRYNSQDFTNQGSRGSAKWDGPDFGMLMGQHKVGRKGLFHFNIMMSADAIIAGGHGYPLLFQTGESWKGIPLVDRQHPHDLFSELSVSYAYSFNKSSDLYLYLGYPGEPSIGSVAFMHRPSALTNPDAPISHHWNDGTHITFGVATIGYRYKQFKLEGSLFNGREPDEDRYGFDKPQLNSASTRLSWAPNKNWSLQASRAYLKSPEALRPDENVDRTTASAIYSTTLRKKILLDATALWGQNTEPGHNPSNAFLLEANLSINHTAVYTRYEHVQKASEELSLAQDFNGDEHLLFNVDALTLGAAYDVFNIKHTALSIGGQLSIYRADNRIRNLYGNWPLGGEVYLRIYPQRMKM